MTQFVAVEHSHLPLDPTRFDQALDASQASWRRHVNPFGQSQVVEAGILLQDGQQFEVDFVEFHVFCAIKINLS